MVDLLEVVHVEERLVEHQEDRVGVLNKDKPIKTFVSLRTNKNKEF